MSIHLRIIHSSTHVYLSLYPSIPIHLSIYHISKQQSHLASPQQVAHLLKKRKQSLRRADGRRAQPYAPPVPITQHWNPSPVALMKPGKQIQATLSSRQPFFKYHSRMDSFETQAELGRKESEGLYEPRERTCQTQNDKMYHPRQRPFRRPCTGASYSGSHRTL